MVLLLRAVALLAQLSWALASSSCARSRGAEACEAQGVHPSHAAGRFLLRRAELLLAPAF